MKSNFDIHAEITNRIIAAIERGAGDFIMPWHRAPSAKRPINATTQKAYRGVNILSLWIASQALGYQSNKWATFKQWKDRGLFVRKGEKGTPIVFYKQLAITATHGVAQTGDLQGADEDNAKTIPFARASWVFNAEQVEGYIQESDELPERPLFERIAHVDAVIAATKAVIEYGGARACYNRATDRISIPDERAFIGSPTSTAQEAFYSTVLHEVAHWSGAPDRLNREKGKRFADRTYASEELIAELSAAFLCCELGITNEPRPDHAQYIVQYLEILQNDGRAIFQAATAASAAVDYILAFGRPQHKEEAA
jgi:antirestriction protein ArdC